MRIPRPYQIECCEAIRQADSEGCRLQLIALPTGTGKTFIASSIPKVLDLDPWEVMVFLVASEELCFQAVRDIQEANPGLTVTLEKAGNRAIPDADVVVASIDTLAVSPERLEKICKLPIRVIFLDECHGAVSPKCLKVLKALRVLKGEDDIDPYRLLVGLTATPRRHDGLALERVFDKIVYRKTIREMVDAGWLAQPVAYRVDVDVNLDGVSRSKGDFATGDLSRTMNTPRINALVVKKYLEYGAGLPAIAFTVDIQHSEDLASTFREHGIQFEAISARTPLGKRKELVEAHRKMELTGLVSCQALLVGFDSPPATVALWARPTQSGLLYTQGVGRIERPFPAPEAAATHAGYRKANAIIIDFVGTSENHRLYTAATLYGLNPQFDFAGRSITATLKDVENLAAQNRTLDITAYASLADVEAAVSNVELWKPAAIPKLAKTCSQFVWMAQGETTYVLQAPKLTVQIEVTLLGEYEVSRRPQGGKPEALMKFNEPEDAFAYADSLVPDEVVSLIRANSRWRKDPPTEPQCEALWKRDPQIRRRFSDGGAFHRFAVYQFEATKNTAFSKGSISQRLDLLKLASNVDRRAVATP